VRILFCNFEYPPLGGGGGVINALLAEELATRHDVTVLTSQGPGLAVESREKGVRIVRVPVPLRRQQAAASMVSMFGYVLRGKSAGNRLFREARFDVINTHFVLPTGPVGAALARKHRVPNVLSVHGGDLYDPSKWTSPHRHFVLRAWIRSLSRRADAIVGQSSNTIDNLRRFYLPKVEATRIPLGIRRPPDGVRDRARFGLAEGEVVLVTVGRLVARKAIHQLFEVLAALRDLPLRLLVVGGGPLEPALREQAGAAGVSERVKFLGMVAEEEKFAALRASDLFVSTSQHEGFGLVYLEGMACGLPVICYDYGGQTDFLESGVTGELVFLNDVASFVTATRNYAVEPSLRHDKGRGNLTRVEEYFIDRCAARYETLFRSVVTRRSSSTGA
jgi:glycosyltransferase involved in cell wall biosynthesis